MKRKTASLLIAAVALAGLAIGAGPSAAQSEEWGGPSSAMSPAAAPTQGTSAPSITITPASPAPPAKNTKTEVLPWANQPTLPIAEAPPTGDVAATQAAAAQCSGLFEAACRDLKTCAWVADVALQDGTLVPARCLARPPAPPKAANKAANKPKKTTATAPQAPAVKAAVTRIEDTQQPEKPAKTPAQKIEVKAPPVKEAPKQQEAKQEVKPPEKVTTEASAAPVVVKPPPAKPPSNSATMPSFGSVSPIMPGGGNAVVVTVPPSAE